MNVVVTGASRGIGLELTRLALRRGDSVVAVARRPADSAGLKGLKSEFGDHLRLVTADFLDFKAAVTVAESLKDWSHVDVLINNAGILRKETAPEDFMQSFQVNSVSPFLMIQALLPWLKKSAAPKAVSVTSLMGSVSDNQSGGYYAYRSSKSALNMINKSLSQDLDWLTSIVVHPGWVKTEMGGAGAPVEPVDSAKGIWQVIQNADTEKSGRFFNYTGNELPW